MLRVGILRGLHHFLPVPTHSDLPSDLVAPGVSLHILSLVVVSSPCHMGCSLGQNLGAPIGVYLIVSDDFDL